MSVKKAVERQIGVALWRQIADRIRLSIGNGEFDATGLLPPETALAAQFGVNRHTVRSALASLAEEGIVQARQGHGTVIARRERLSFPISRRTRFSAGIGNQARDIDAVLLSHAIVPAISEIAQALRLAEGDDCVRLETLGKADGVAVSVSVSHFAHGRFPQMAEHFERLGSVTRAFAAQGLDDYVRVSTEIVARHAASDELAVLQLSPGSVVLETTALNAAPDGTPVQFSRTCFAADRMKLTIET